MHYSGQLRPELLRLLLPPLLLVVFACAPEVSMAQASPFMTGATSLQTKTFGRSDGSSAPSAAAYRAGERIRDERTGRIYDHTGRQDVLYKEIVLPSKFADVDMDWSKDRASLWNTAENAETRKNARVAREYLVALPIELTPDQRLGLVRAFSQELSDRYQFAVDLTVHAPRDFPGSDPRNFHAHLLATTREVSIAGLAAKTTLELPDSKRRMLGLGPAINELLHVRERWATVTNEALRDAHHATRIDHRTLEAQGIDREPRPQIPRAAFEMERHGYHSVVAERMREDHAAREQIRLERDSSERPNDRTIDNLQADAAGSRSPPALEEIRRQARESWLRMRQESSASVAPGGSTNTRDDDFSR